MVTAYKYDFFVSHAAEDVPDIDTLIKVLSDAGIERARIYSYGTHASSGDVAAATFAALSASRYFIFWGTRVAAEKRGRGTASWLAQEVNETRAVLAQQGGAIERMLPVIEEGVDATEFLGGRSLIYRTMKSSAARDVRVRDAAQWILRVSSHGLRRTYHGVPFVVFAMTTDEARELWTGPPSDWSGEDQRRARELKQLLQSVHKVDQFVECYAQRRDEWRPLSLKGTAHAAPVGLTSVEWLGRAARRCVVPSKPDRPVLLYSETEVCFQPVNDETAAVVARVATSGVLVVDAASLYHPAVFDRFQPFCGIGQALPPIAAIGPIALSAFEPYRLIMDFYSHPTLRGFWEGFSVKMHEPLELYVDSEIGLSRFLGRALSNLQKPRPRRSNVRVMESYVEGGDDR